MPPQLACSGASLFAEDRGYIPHCIGAFSLPPTHPSWCHCGVQFAMDCTMGFGSCRFDPIWVPRFSLILRRSSRLPNLPPAAAPGGLPNATAACGRWCEVTAVHYLTSLNIRSSPFKFVFMIFILLVVYIFIQGFLVICS